MKSVSRAPVGAPDIAPRPAMTSPEEFGKEAVLPASPASSSVLYDDRIGLLGKSTSFIAATSANERYPISRRNSISHTAQSIHREKITSTIDDPLKQLGESGEVGAVDCIAISNSDEYRIISAIADASKKKCIGTVFSVKIDFSLTKSLRLGVKDLYGGILIVSVVKRKDGKIGPSESSGVAIGASHVPAYYVFFFFFFNP